MSELNAFTAEHRSREWGIVLQFEEGSLPASNWNEDTLSVVTQWYAKYLSPEDAWARYELYFHRNQHRLSHRLGHAPVATDAIEAMGAVWQSLMQRALEGEAA